ncbi:hypothetical protein GCM10027033_25790 [Leucobacter ruminantium]
MRRDVRVESGDRRTVQPRANLRRSPATAGECGQNTHEPDGQPRLALIEAKGFDPCRVGQRAARSREGDRLFHVVYRPREEEVCGAARVHALNATNGDETREIRLFAPASLRCVHRSEGFRSGCIDEPGGAESVGQ